MSLARGVRVAKVDRAYVRDQFLQRFLVAFTGSEQSRESRRHSTRSATEPNVLQSHEVRSGAQRGGYCDVLVRHRGAYDGQSLVAWL